MVQFAALFCQKKSVQSPENKNYLILTYGPFMSTINYLTDCLKLQQHYSNIFSAVSYF